MEPWGALHGIFVWSDESLQLDWKKFPFVSKTWTSQVPNQKVQPRLLLLKLLLFWQMNLIMSDVKSSLQWELTEVMWENPAREIRLMYQAQQCHVWVTLTYSSFCQTPWAIKRCFIHHF